MNLVKDERPCLRFFEISVNVNIIHTYIHNWPLQPFSQDYGLFVTPLMLLVLILYVSGGTYSLKPTPNDRY